jgi:hypothetical protein
MARTTATLKAGNFSMTGTTASGIRRALLCVMRILTKNQETGHDDTCKDGGDPGRRKLLHHMSGGNAEHDDVDERHRKEQNHDGRDQGPLTVYALGLHF